MSSRRSASSRAASRELGALRRISQPLWLQAPSKSQQHELFLLAVIEGGVAPASVQAKVVRIYAQTLLLAPPASLLSSANTLWLQSSPVLPEVSPPAL